MNPINAQRFTRFAICNGNDEHYLLYMGYRVFALVVPALRVDFRIYIRHKRNAWPTPRKIRYTSIARSCKTYRPIVSQNRHTSSGTTISRTVCISTAAHGSWLAYKKHSLNNWRMNILAIYSGWRNTSASPCWNRVNSWWGAWWARCTAIKSQPSMSSRRVIKRTERRQCARTVGSTSTQLPKTKYNGGSCA